MQFDPDTILPMSSKPFFHFELGDYQSAFADALKIADEVNLAARLWAGDHTLWGDSPNEISNRLGWLNIAESLSSEISELQSFTEEIKAGGISQVLLLGMGGSSLAPEVFSKIFGAKSGFPELSVLDSTDPGAVKSAQGSHKPSSTLYIISTKSGGTVETLSFFKTFYNQALAELGKDIAGQHFVAITDPGSKLADLAKQHNFRRTFTNDPNIGGRYSALSYFGLVPAALLGVDLKRLLERARLMAINCGADVLNSENPGVRLGLALSSLGKAGRDKATFVAPPEIASFGDWAEQLIAESTGKEGKGILPVVNERLGEADLYGDDRVFINLNLSGEQNSQDIGELQAAGHPVIEINWQDKSDLGGQLFLWEFATAVAGYGLGINPFDQPNVESAKVQGRRFVEAYAESGLLPPVDSQALSSSSINSFLTTNKAGDYIALQAYIKPNDEAWEVLQKFRLKLQKKYRLASTLGYGPRFLHSTGQLHKGDGGNGLFIQFVSESSEDLAVPAEVGSSGSEISYDVLKQAQALGDSQALRDAGRRVLTFMVEDDFVIHLEKIIGEFA
jgi:glucose-6-phosphate isomerase